MNLDDLTIEEVRAIQITDIRARLAARTPGSWLATLDNDGWCVNAVLDEGTPKERMETLARLGSGSPSSDTSDACFIASAADDIEVLLDEVERLTAERDDLLAWSQRFSDLVGVDGSTEAGRDEAFAKLYDAAKTAGKLVKK